MICKLQGHSVLLLGAVGIFSISLMAGGYLLGDGLRRAKSAERSISVRGVSERDVTANLATWTIEFGHEGDDLDGVNTRVDQQSAAVRRFFTQAGFKFSEMADSGVTFSRRTLTDDDGRPIGDRVTVKRSIELRTPDVLRAKRANERLAELLKQGVELEGSTLNFSFTKLNELKPPMIAEATRRARDSAEQFARDSGAEVGRIRSASQGYFSVGPRDGADSEEARTALNRRSRRSAW